jgi:hypothetical protein
VSFFEECLTLGRYLSQAEKEALYRYLLEQKREVYKSQARTLIKENFLEVNFANGEIQYGVEANCVYYVARRIHSAEFSPTLRRLKLGIPELLKGVLNEGLILSFFSFYWMWWHECADRK